ncbi:MAG: molybdenum cofactor guanylyltransferase [Gemmatimonadetes bacterium]|nr:molybdenum cofactor guanylyltransferase [Gemmatimonadota bacterium]
MTDPFAILILAGGRSRRLGRDKRLLDVGGVPLLARTVERALGLDQPVFVQVDARGAATLPRPGRVAVRIDRAEGTGPLPLLLDALEQLRVAVLLLAADLPRLSSDALADLVEAWRGDPDRVQVPEHDRGLEPLCAIYPASAAPWLRSEGRTQPSLQRILRAADPGRVHRRPAASKDFLNLNEAEDLGRWRSE